MKISLPALFAASLLTLLPACSGETLDVDGSPGTGGSTNGSTDGSSTGQAKIVFSGYTSRPVLPGFSDAVVVSLSSLDEGATGTVVFGDGDGTLPPMDPTKVYPEGSEYEYGRLYGTGPTPFEGHAYTVGNVHRLTGNRVQFSLSFNEAYADWCAPQVSWPQPAGSNLAYSCIPYHNGAFDCSGGDFSACVSSWPSSPGYPDVTLSWDIWTMCAGAVCACNADGCTADMNGNLTTFNLRLEEDGNELNGSVGTADLEVFLSRN